jgi:hypothetical protein
MRTLRKLIRSSISCWVSIRTVRSSRSNNKKYLTHFSRNKLKWRNRPLRPTRRNLIQRALWVNMWLVCLEAKLSWAKSLHNKKKSPFHHHKRDREWIRLFTREKVRQATPSLAREVSHHKSSQRNKSVVLKNWIKETQANQCKLSTVVSRMYYHHCHCSHFSQSLLVSLDTTWASCSTSINRWQSSRTRQFPQRSLNFITIIKK